MDEPPPLPPRESRLVPLVTGVLLGRVWFRRNDTHLRLSIVPGSASPTPRRRRTAATSSARIGSAISATASPRDAFVASHRAEPHHVFTQSGWIGFWMHAPADTSPALGLLAIAARVSD